jgi:hypothetical protein
LTNLEHKKGAQLGRLFLLKSKKFGYFVPALAQQLLPAASLPQDFFSIMAVCLASPFLESHLPHSLPSAAAALQQAISSFLASFFEQCAHSLPSAFAALQQAIISDLAL